MSKKKRKRSKTKPQNNESNQSSIQKKSQRKKENPNKRPHAQSDSSQPRFQPVNNESHRHSHQEQRDSNPPGDTPHLSSDGGVVPKRQKRDVESEQEDKSTPQLSTGTPNYPRSNQGYIFRSSRHHAPEPALQVLHLSCYF